MVVIDNSKYRYESFSLFPYSECGVTIGGCLQNKTADVIWSYDASDVRKRVGFGEMIRKLE